jgi:eukaryotic-like serine/threonine-protein kinase
MTDDPHDEYEELIIKELSSYQSQLDLGNARSGEVNYPADLPMGLKRELDDFRECLDLISTSRKESQGNRSVFERADYQSLPNDDEPFFIGRFEIAEQLGIGGFGIVFRGIDPVVGREVAIKIPRPEFLGSQDLTDRFAREAAAVAQLEHPNIVPVYESDCFEIVPYIVMPYIAGKTLAEWRATQTDVSPLIAAEIVRQLASAVAHAHERGVLHRDLKPGNVLLAQLDPNSDSHGLEFVPKLTDFGLAKCAGTNSADTRTGSMLGTASYMSPEQVEGRTRDITSRSDIYGLGVILYELLTGNPPFYDVNQMRTIQKVIRDDPPSLRSSQIKIPLDLEVICLKCLEKTPALRYSSAGALADDLHCFLNGKPIQARPIPMISRLGKWIRRHPVLATFIIAVVLCLVAIEGVSLRYNRLLDSMHSVAEVERKTRHQTEIVAKRRAYVSDMRQAKINRDQHNISQMLTLLERYRLKSGEPDFRDFAWWHLYREYEEASRVLGIHEQGATAVAVAASGKVAASAGSDGIIKIWGLPKGNLNGSLHGHVNGAVKSVRFSPNCERIVSAGEDGTVRVWDVSKYTQVFSCRNHEGHVNDAAYSPNGDVIASCGADHQIRLWDPTTGEQIGVLNGHSNTVNCLAFHPTEDTLVSGGKDSKICFWEWKNRRPDARIEKGMIQLPSPVHWARSLVFDPNGRSMDVGVSNGLTVRFSLESGQFGKELHRRSAYGAAISFAWPQKDPLIAAVGYPEIHVSDRLDPSMTGECEHGHQHAVVSAAVSADGSSMISASEDGEIRYWPDFQDYSRINVARDKNGIWNDERRVYEIQWRNQYLAADFQQREVVLYRMPERKLERLVSKANEDAFVLSPSGKLLLIFQMNGLVTCYQTDVEKPVWIQQLSPLTQPFFPEFSVIDDADQQAIVAWGNELIVLSMQSPQILRRFKHPDKVWQVAFSEDEYRLAVPISACNDGCIRFWDIETARVQKTFRANIGPTYSVAVSSDRQLLATAGEDYRMRVWQHRSLQPVVVLPLSVRPGPSKIGFLKGSGGSEILVRQDVQLSLWGIHDEAELLAFPDCGQFGTISISPDGKQLAVPQHGWVRLIDGRPNYELAARPARIKPVDLSMPR